MVRPISLLEPGRIPTMKVPKGGALHEKMMYSQEDKTFIMVGRGTLSIRNPWVNLVHPMQRLQEL